MELYTATTNSKATQQLDEIALEIPESVLLDQINYQPLEKTIKEGKPIQLNRGTVMVSGISKDIESFSEWVGILEKKVWIQSVETLDYDYLTNDTSNFLLKIKYDEN